MILIKNLRNEKPTQPWQVKVDRSSPLGNPFYMADESQRDEVCDKYKKWLQEVCDYRSGEKHTKQRQEFRRLAGLYFQYRKLELFCWCAPKRCHAETIRDFIEVKNFD